jgi:N-acetylmuramoyl-L-alanine amidase
MLRIALTLGLLFVNFVSFAREFNPYYYKVTAKNGDAVSTILSKYGLISQECNINKFYNLNELNKKSKLIADKEYILPIKVYRYNGKSIRSTLKLEDSELAKDIQKYNDVLLKKGLRKESFLKNNLLLVPVHYIECNGNKEAKAETEKANASSKKEKKEVVRDEVKKSPRKSNEVKIVELFGPNYREVNMFDDQLEGQVFYVSSGHGGPDPGAQCTDLQHTLCEDEYAYDVALRLVRDLTQHGATVHMIIQDENDGIRDDAFLDCDNDELCNGKDLPVRQLDRLKQRADHINRLYDKYKKQGVAKQTAIMIHVDSRNKEQRQDVFFYHYGSDKTSKDLAYNLQTTFEEKYEIFQKGRGYKGYVANRGLYMLRKVNPSAVYIELANIRNHSDHIRLMESANRQALANWLFEGLTGIR